ncbi:MAG: saccharopine dehydrogenase [Candidatus Marinimicrobia bacterium]|jgi:saccharopine dehydrogenase-like NADP-dependent oxidoreductase|nr:saccharopine dehydrogenase [Candidatus Neomarinimicrobiota bacterium]MBT3634221.1 saccharopine dehydrogenase [Candidatus Neomarinimicrobiota bacterium]MBT3682980.1 saccharopine dehydrogenase [Candidatus Neomarinimicrobiota bacterium]MBT3760030.1 saccharopine dehydrogenase [Candidatus Neomarinimicrobiota bacterium]MBT3896203.1 saccharopine dehydrogenase [Candidatus Neomarinimicrobiota bacterium]
MKIIVLGAGLVGAPMAIDLNSDENFDVTVADYSDDALNNIKAKCPELSIIQKDLSNTKDVTSLVSDFDLVVNAVPGFMGFETAKAIIKAGKDFVCIAFYEENPFELDQIALDNNVTMIMDCGIYPGMGSVMIMDVAQKLDKVDSVLTYVGGLPEIREWPSEYKAVFSPIDVIEEYIRPARYIENGFEVVRPALSDPEYIFFPKIGTLEAFNTDGLRTLATTIDAPNMKEKTLRYPGHIEKMTVLRELGFFSKDKTINVNGAKISPMELTSQILFPNWKLKPGEADITIFQSTIEGMKDGRKIRYTIDMNDRYCSETDVISMARTTGYTATQAIRMIADGLYTHKGISPPEYIGQYPNCVAYMLKGLKERNIIYHQTVSEII